MNLINNSSDVMVCFGNGSNGMCSGEYAHAQTSGKFPPGKHFPIHQTWSFKKTVILHQVHGNKGIIVTKTSLKDLNPFSHKGDFIITDLTQIGLAIATADCLPLIMHDTKLNVIAAIHAGWKGSVAGIVRNVLHTMQKKFLCNLKNIHAYFGPAAKKCCYETNEQIVKEMTSQTKTYNWLRRKNNKPFIDLAHYNKSILIESGINPSHCFLDSNYCTICNSSFHSYRREKEESGRQISFVVMK